MLTWILTGGLTAPLLMAGGAFFLVYLRGYPFRNPHGMKAAFKARQTGAESPRRALMQALAGTLGVGNLVGVAGAIRIGGAGAVFWMWLSAILAMILKYAEILLSVAHRREGREGKYGGAVYYIKDVFSALRCPRIGVLLASVFALFMIFNSLTMGCVIQVNAVSSAVKGGMGIPPILCGILLCILTLPPLFKGSRGISALTDILVPLMTVGYLVLSFTVLYLRRDLLGDAFFSIFKEAFSGEALGGGVLGFLTTRALRVGTMRGILSNEAGCGTSPTAHAAADNSPAYQGVWGILEVAVDTLLLCSVSAMVILTGEDPALFAGNDMLICMAAYTQELGQGAAIFFAAAIASFGYATLLCWGAYGQESLRFLSRRPILRVLYIALFGIAILSGSLSQGDLIWNLSDFCIASMTTINLVVLFLAKREILEQTHKTYAEKKPKNKKCTFFSDKRQKSSKKRISFRMRI